MKIGLEDAYDKTGKAFLARAGVVHTALNAYYWLSMCVIIPGMLAMSGGGWSLYMCVFKFVMFLLLANIYFILVTNFFETHDELVWMGKKLPFLLRLDPLDAYLRCDALFRTRGKKAAKLFAAVFAAVNLPVSVGMVASILHLFAIIFLIVRLNPGIAAAWLIVIPATALGIAAIGISHIVAAWTVLLVSRVLAARFPEVRREER